MIIEVTNLVNSFSGITIHNKLNFSVKKQEICAIVGVSGSGKTTLLRSILQLQEPKSGTIKVFGKSIAESSPKELLLLRQRWGVLFQRGALFSSLNVLDNICFPLKEFSSLSFKSRKDIAMLRISQVGLDENVAWKFPAELSGGMIKRVALARAIALEPELLFLDEPTAGLDPNSADRLEDLILHLQHALGFTTVLVTHDLDTLWNVADRVAFLGDGKVLAHLPMNELVVVDNPMIQSYFSGKRSKLRNKEINS